MFKSIVSKTLYEKRLTMVFWALGIAAIVLLTLSVYPSFSQPGSLGDSLQDLPKSLQSLVGDSASFKTVPGYIGQQLFALRVPLLMIICALILATGLLVGEESEGTLQTLLVQPVSRTRVFLEKLLAVALILAVVSLGVIVGVEIALLLIHEQFSVLRLLQSIFGAWLITMVFAVFTLMLGAVTGKKGVTSGVAAAVTFACYFLTSLAPAVSSLRGVERLSPFHYYNNPIIAQHGLNGGHIILLSGLIGVMVVISLIIFNKRDIYQH